HFWLRARWEVPQLAKSPALRRVMLNGVQAAQVADEPPRVLGVTDGTANQQFSLGQSILDGPRVTMKAKPGALTMIGNRPVPLAWEQVPSFARSKETDPHFTVDVDTGTITFGDGRHGMNPPPRYEVTVEYEVTRGGDGSVGADSIIVLDESLPYVK